MNTSEIFESINQLSVLVVGDVMLDNYQYGNAHRISPEAPVPVVHITYKESRLGGAANVALNCAALGAKVTVAATVGVDNSGEELIALLQQQHINTDLILEDRQKPTTTKTRIIARHHQLMRVDEEDTSPLSSDIEHPFLDKVLKYIQMYKPHVIILQDYNKGLLKENIIQRIIAHGSIYQAVITVDPKEENFFTYQGATIFKPNLLELTHAVGAASIEKTLDNLDKYSKDVLQQLQAKHLLVTLSERGIYYHNATTSKIVPTIPRTILDVSGAGDTVISVASLVYAATQDIHISATAANVAGGIVCESVGVVPIAKDKLLSELEQLID